ncbi:MAG: glycosyltransferase family 2 protein [Actinomycetota bacterium]
MRVSVALCTYNGEPWLDEQLRSLLGQTAPPFEVVACDDGSSDRTVEVLERFRDAAPFPVRVYVNPVNLGTVGNFERAISLCEGDVISLCDQDDVWMPDKLERTTAVFESRPDVALVFTDAEMVDADLRPLGKRLWNEVLFTPRLRRAFARGHAVRTLAERNVVTGATMAFRAEYRELVLPLGNAEIHDERIAFLLSAVAPLGMVEEPTMLYRIHPEQQRGVSGPQPVREPSLRHQLRRSLQKDPIEYLRAVAPLQEVAAFLESWADVFRPRPGAVGWIHSRIVHMRRRHEIQLGGLGAVGDVARELFSGRYHHHSRGMRSAARDLVLGPGRAALSRTRRAPAATRDADEP